MSSTFLPLRHARGLSVVVLAFALGGTLTACGGGNSPSASQGPQSQNTAGGHQLAAVWPFTGLPAQGKAPTHPPLVVKIPNTAESDPQVGMSQADMVYEELVEGGITRLGVVYYQHVPAEVGPVRSMRNSDIDIALPSHGRIVASGAAPPVIRALNRSKVPYYTEGGPGYFRVGNRVAPYNLMVHLRQLARTIRKKSPVPPGYLPWGSASDFKGKTPAHTINVPMSPGRTSVWKYGRGSYVNTNSYEPSNDQFKPASILVIQVKEGRARYLDPAGNPVPITIYHGKGKMLLFHGGKVVRGTWKKAGARSRVKLSTKKGPMKMPPGKVFLEFKPATSGKVTWSKR